MHARRTVILSAGRAIPAALGLMALVLGILGMHMMDSGRHQAMGVVAGAASHIALAAPPAHGHASSMQGGLVGQAAEGTAGSAANMAGDGGCSGTAMAGACVLAMPKLTGALPLGFPATVVRNSLAVSATAPASPTAAPGGSPPSLAQLCICRT